MTHTQLQRGKPRDPGNRNDGVDRPRSRIPPLLTATLVTIAAYLIYDNAFPPVMPTTLLVQYMVITVIGVLLYYSYDDARWAEFKAPVLAVMRDERLLVVRWFFLLAIPAVVGYTSYNIVKPSVDAPVELRQVHPAPPSTLKVYGKSYNLTTLENPVRAEVLRKLASDREGALEQYDEAVMAGREVYYQNCFYCHGDLLDGDGHFAQGFNPLPIDFQDVGTIAQLQEAFLFWRITTGGPGLPKEGTPWNSAMPVWHEMLDEEQVWNVITFLYDYVGQVPRIWDPETSKTVTGMKDELVGRRKTMQGMDLYRWRCEVCHGEEGMGDGPAAEYMYPLPRDFSLGLFKYKTSPGSLPPRDVDLVRTIMFGLPGTGMPGWHSLMSEQQAESLVPVIKSFDIASTWVPEDAPDDAVDDDGKLVQLELATSISEDEPLDGQVPYSDESLHKGKLAFEKTCSECHGDTGRGNILSGKKLADDWGNRLWPRDLTKPWTWRWSESDSTDTERHRDETVKAIYRRLSIGIPGTPMPAHRAVEEGNEDPVSLEDRWHIANYVYSLRDTTTPPGDSGVVRAAKLTGALPGEVDSAAWDEVPATTLHLVPNIIKEERLFTPLSDAVTVRAVYNDREIAFLLEVDDRTESRPGIAYFTDLQDENLDMHADAIAIQFPKEIAYQTAPVVEKPLYRHGDTAYPTTIWYWNAGSVQPQRAPRSALFDASGPDKSLQLREGDTSLSADGQWVDGRWRVIMKRPRHDTDAGDVVFRDGQFIPISFANWDGSNGEVGAKHTLTTWYWLLLPPEEDLMRSYGLPAGIAFGVFLAGLLTVRGQRNADA